LGVSGKSADLLIDTQGVEKGVSFLGAATVARRIFRPEFAHRLGHPSLRAIRSAPFDRVPDVLNFFPPWRVVQPLPIIRWFGRRPRAKQPLLLFRSVPASVNARPRPVLRPLDQGGTVGVSFHVANQGQEITAGFYRQRLIAILVDVPIPNGPRFRVITLRVRQGDPLHELREIPVCPRVEHPMPMIRHQAISKNAHEAEEKRYPHLSCSPPCLRQKGCQRVVSSQRKSPSQIQDSKGYDSRAIPGKPSKPESKLKI